MSAAKHGDPTLNFRTHTVEGRKLTIELSSDFHVCTMVQKHTQINNEIISSKKKNSFHCHDSKLFLSKLEPAPVHRPTYRPSVLGYHRLQFYLTPRA